MVLCIVIKMSRYESIRYDTIRESSLCCCCCWVQFLVVDFCVLFHAIGKMLFFTSSPAKKRKVERTERTDDDKPSSNRRCCCCVSWCECINNMTRVPSFPREFRADEFPDLKRQTTRAKKVFRRRQYLERLGLPLNLKDNEGL